MEEKQYYEAYDDRYRQVHAECLQWFADDPTPIVADVLNRYGIRREDPILEIGCGEGRDAAFLLKRGYNLLATDISEEAVRYCRTKHGFAESFQILDCLIDRLPRKFDAVYAVAVIHMLVRQQHRDGFWRFLTHQLTLNGIALVCSMGNGESAIQSDIRTAFARQSRTHESSGRCLQLAGTSCRTVTWDTFREEIYRNGLRIVEEGQTAAPPDFPVMMYAVVKRS